MSKVSASPPGFFLLHSLQSRSQTSLGYSGTYTRVPGSVNPLISSSKLKAQVGLSITRREESPRVGLRCYSSSGPGGSSSGDGDSKSVLDAFFLGKALAEALNERVESAVGEFLSTIGRLQAEQQKQIQEFQEDVFERAKKAKEHAAREALEAQGLISKPTTADTTAVTESVSLTSTYTVIPADTGPSTSPDTETDADPAAKGPTLGASNDD